MSFVKIITTRNAFSREYGTWLIVLFNLLLPPLLLQSINLNTGLFIFSVLLFLMFRFEIMDAFYVELNKPRKFKLLRALSFLIASAGIVLYLLTTRFIGTKTIALLFFLGMGMVVFNLVTRRKKDKRQVVVAQIVLVSSMALISAVIYFLMTGRADHTFFRILLLNALFFSNAVVYVRSKTEGAPYDIYALTFALSVCLLILIMNLSGLIELNALILFVPTVVKTLDNVILNNTKVPLRRVGLNETIHSILYIILFCFVFH